MSLSKIINIHVKETDILLSLRIIYTVQNISPIEYGYYTSEMFMIWCQPCDDHQLKENNLIYNVYNILMWWICTHDEMNYEMINAVINVLIYTVQYNKIQKKVGQNIVPNDSGPNVSDAEWEVGNGRWD